MRKVNENNYVVNRDDGRELLVDVQGYRTLRRNGLTDPIFTEAWRGIPSDKLEEGKSLRLTINMGRMVGRTPIVKAPIVQPHELAKFARRQTVQTNKHPPSRVVVMKGPKPSTQYVTLVGDWLARDGLWMLRTAYCGRYVYPQPWDFVSIAKNNLSLASVLEFWCRAAFLYNDRDYESNPHGDSWARILEVAAQNHRREVVERVQYEAIRDQWPATGIDTAA